MIRVVVADVKFPFVRFQDGRSALEHHLHKVVPCGCDGKPTEDRHIRHFGVDGAGEDGIAVSIGRDDSRVVNIVRICPTEDNILDRLPCVDSPSMLDEPKHPDCGKTLNLYLVRGDSLVLTEIKLADQLPVFLVVDRFTVGQIIRRDILRFALDIVFFGVNDEVVCVSRLKGNPPPRLVK